MPQLTASDPEVRPRLGIVGFELHRLVEGLGGLTEGALLVEQETDVDQGEGAGLGGNFLGLGQREDLLEAPQGLVPPTVVELDQRQVVERADGVGPQLEGFLEAAAGGGVVAGP